MICLQQECPAFKVDSSGKTYCVYDGEEIYTRQFCWNCRYFREELDGCTKYPNGYPLTLIEGSGETGIAQHCEQFQWKKNKSRVRTCLRPKVLFQEMII